MRSTGSYDHQRADFAKTGFPGRSINPALPGTQRAAGQYRHCSFNSFLQQPGFMKMKIGGVHWRLSIELEVCKVFLNEMLLDCNQYVIPEDQIKQARLAGGIRVTQSVNTALL